ncbi:MAG: BatA domain-containing protein [Verrucomicrobiota bacterium]
MNWLFPGFLAGAALIGVPVLLHFLRMKPRATVRFPSLRFLGESALRDTRRHRLRRWITLLLRCLAIGLLAAAFARPFLVDSAARNRSAMVIALDNSMSMQTRGRWETAQRQAMEQLDQLGAGDQAALLWMQPEPAWLVPMTDDLARVRKALETARPGFEKTRYAKPLRLAAATLAAQVAGTKKLVWIGDEQNIGWRSADLTEKLPAGVSVHFLEPAPAPPRQAAIIALRKSIGTTGGLEVTIRQFHATPDVRQLTVRDGDRVLAEQNVSLRPGDNRISVALPWPTGAMGLRVSLDPDDLVADDSAWMALNVTATNTVLLDAVAETDFLAHAIKATQKLDETGWQSAPLPQGIWPLESVAVLRNAHDFRNPLLAQLNRFFAAGGPLLIFLDGSAEQTAWLKGQGIQVNARPVTDEPLHLRDWDSEHPILSAFAGQSLLPLLEVEFYRGFNLSGDALVPLANWRDGKIALAEWTTDGRRLLLAGFPAGREAMNWPTKPSFVPFVHQALQWLGSFHESRENWHVGERIPLPEGGGRWRALDTPIPQPDQMVKGDVQPSIPGLYEFSGTGTRKIFAVNVPTEESDLSPWPHLEQLAALESKDAPQEMKASALPISSEIAENRQRLWWWMLALAGLLLLAELALANRTSL